MWVTVRSVTVIHIIHTLVEVLNLWVMWVTVRSVTVIHIIHKINAFLRNQKEEWAFTELLPSRSEQRFERKR